jgi:hypothetical protein
MEVSGNRVFVAVKNMPIFIVRTKHFVKNRHPLTSKVGSRTTGIGEKLHINRHKEKQTPWKTQSKKRRNVS